MKNIFLLVWLHCTFAWTPSSWQNIGVKYQMPKYPDLNKLNLVKKELSNCAPLVFSGECRDLTNKLAHASVGNGFVLMGGDCAETFNDFTIDKVKNDFRLMLQMAIVLTFASTTPIVKIGRVAGQFAKPRSENTEVVDGVEIPVYRGDIINEYSVSNRIPDPQKMLQAYYQSAQTLNLLRAFSNGGYADISKLYIWDSVNDITKQVHKSLKFFKALGYNLESPLMTKTSYYTAHEALLLDYEEPMTRIDSITNDYYDCSAHMLWLGERTRQINSSHIEFLSGIKNSIGIKVSDKYNKHEILDIINKLNPDNEFGKIALITRMGSEKLIDRLPELVQFIKKNNKRVLWICDPMHGNTIKVNGRKTRMVSSITEEINSFFDIHNLMNTIPGGIHLEMTSNNVTECIGNNVIYSNLDNYQSLCDPRLNGQQSLEIAFQVAEKLNKL